ncbi:MAG: 50S ribosomal protein L30e [Candidatus Anstonellales archaeon]
MAEEELKKKRDKKGAKVTRKRKKKEGEGEIEGALKLMVETGKYEMGFRRGQADALLGKAKAIVLAKNTPPINAADIQHYARLSGIPVFVVDKTSLELGSICGRPHPVSVISIYDEGESNILKIAGRKGKK